MEPVAKRVVVTFRDGLPLGTHGAFKYGGQSWIAVPADKYSRVLSVTDVLLGALARVRGQLTRWVATHPSDAPRIVMILKTIAQAEETQRLMTTEKTEAQTS